MTMSILRQESSDGSIICTMEYEKYGCFQAFVYQRDDGPYTRVIHESRPTPNKSKAIDAYKRFIRKYCY